MTKRIISLFLVCILAIPILAVPAYATNVSTSDDTEYHSKVLEYLDSFLNTISKIAEDTYGTFAYVRTIFTKLGSILDHLDAWNENIFQDFWAKLAAWLLVFWEGNENLGVTGILPTINQGFSTVSGVLGVLDVSVNNVTSTIDKWFSRFDKIWMQAINSNVASIRSTLLTFVDSITERLDELLSFFRVDSKPSEDFKDKTDDITNGMDTMPDVTYPDFEDIDIEFADIYTGNSIFILSDFFGVFFNGNSVYLYFLMTLVFTFSLMSFVLFGKR